MRENLLLYWTRQSPLLLDKGEVFNNIGFCAFCTGEEKNLLMEELALRGSFFFGVITEVAASALFFLAATREDCIFCTGTEAFCTGTVAVFLTALGPTDCVCVVICCIVCSFFSCFFDFLCSSFFNIVLVLVFLFFFFFIFNFC